MITLRELVTSHRDIAAITGEECQLIAAVLQRVAGSWLIRRLLPPALRERALALRMLAATLSKAPDRPADRSFAGQVRLLMRGGKPAKEEWSQAELEGKHG